MIPVTLYIYVIPMDRDRGVFLKKPVELPIPPAAGIVLINVIRHRFGDPEEYPIQRVDIDMESGEVTVILENQDYKHCFEDGRMTFEELIKPKNRMLYYHGWAVDEV